MSQDIVNALRGAHTEIVGCQYSACHVADVMQQLIDEQRKSEWKSPSDELPPENYEVLGFYHGDSVYCLEYLGDGLWAEMVEGQIINEPELWTHYPEPVQIDDNGKRLEK